MARNRKRAKERRDRRPQTVGSRSSVAGARPTIDDGIPDPLEHAAPDAQLADAGLALGRIERLGDEPSPPFAGEEEAEPAGEGGAGAGVGIGAGFDGDDGEGPPGGGGSVSLPAPGAVPEPRAKPRARLIAFLEGSWRELQRVQWPDRRQVVQATAVVVGFVIVAGVFLAVADTAASHLMSYILTGH